MSLLLEQLQQLLLLDSAVPEEFEPTVQLIGGEHAVAVVVAEHKKVGGREAAASQHGEQLVARRLLL